MMFMSVFFALLAISSLTNALPITALQARQSVSAVSAAEIASFHPFAFYAASAYCNPNTTRDWTCGANCDANPTFKPIASGGDGNAVQFWYVGYDPMLNTVIVAHQGTDTSKLLPLLTDADVLLGKLDSTLFPGVSSSVEAHTGFRDEHAKTATGILNAVNTGISSFSAPSVTVVGHSLGGALALLDTVFLQLHLPSNISISMRGFGTPRVGNQAFVDYVDTHLPNLVARVNNRKDLVPILPGRFLGLHHPSGERHILDDGSWVACAGQDSTNSECTTGDVSNIFESKSGDHAGPYTGTGVTRMGC